jgi:predicted site-specific integrase-resolvase
MKNTHSTKQAAKRIGVSFRTLNRWLASGLIRPSVAIPMGGGRTLWRWTEIDITRGRKVNAMQRPGPKVKRKKRLQ